MAAAPRAARARGLITQGLAHQAQTPSLLSLSRFVSFLVPKRPNSPSSSSLSLSIYLFLLARRVLPNLPTSRRNPRRLSLCHPPTPVEPAEAMECVLGVVGRGFAVVAADTSAVQSILVHKTDEDKVMLLDSHKLMGASGEPGDRVQFTEFIQKNLHLYQFRNNIPLTTAATANFTRGELATALRKNPYFVNIILAGYDKDAGASMYYIDYIATLHKIDKGAFGYGSYFCLSLMDKLYRPDMTVEEAVDLVDKCIKEIRLRLVVAPPNFVIKIVDKDGARKYARRESISDSPSEAATTTTA